MQLARAAFLVSGAASGLGAATARRLVGAGARVALADVNTEGVRALAAALGADALALPMDVTAETSVTEALARVEARFGTLRGVVHCAGVAPAEKILGRDGPHRLDAFARVIGVNLIGTFNLLRLAAAVISRAEPTASGERGVIVNTASVAAFEGQVGQAAYAAAKGGVASLTLPAARELARHGIRVVAIAPGIFATPMVEAMPAEVQAALAATVPFPPRLGAPDEFAALACHVIENEMLNGCVLRIDGALRMAAR